MFVEAGGCPKSKSIALSEYSSGLVIYLFLRKNSKFQISYIMFLETHTCFYTSFNILWWGTSVVSYFVEEFGPST